MRTITALVLFLLATHISFFQETKTFVKLLENNDLIASNVIIKDTVHKGVNAVRVLDDGNNTEAKFVKIPDLNFDSGTIEVELAGAPMTGASANARGFVGIAFRISEDDSRFECIYLRPTNGRARNMIRRNHSVQYISYPEFPWFRLRKEFPKKYETYVDLAPGEWTKVKIMVQGETAELYVHGSDQPTLIVDDLKHGGDGSGSIGLWVGPGTEAYFTNLTVTK
ncbi:hypothetical protein [Flagellimonas nanhaiensis]|uniref:DUF1080 domain-containing protein n=1 Tax=Flagellimonas nanhaiensis TaxID=2292706 RepID=A0A371JLY8_9FLAO|nr:hypothetical protein [Allomuricauda nanhaiensis]RDY58074.1 hypothetical protein DX873_16235 [Allomuricauda nanhaiensis]